MGIPSSVQPPGGGADDRARLQYLEYVNDYITGLSKTYDARVVGLIGTVSIAQFVISALTATTANLPRLAPTIHVLVLFSMASFYLSLFCLIWSIRPRNYDKGSPIGEVITAAEGHQDLANLIRSIGYDNMIDYVSEELHATACVAKIKSRWIIRSLFPLAFGFFTLTSAFVVLVLG